MFNYGCVILDVCPVRIGEHTMIGPNTHIYTSCHSLDSNERLLDVEFGKPVTIGKNVFNGCEMLRNVIFGQNSILSTIEEGCFKNCVNLETISVPRNLRTIGKEAFYGCSSLKNIIFEENGVIQTFDSSCFSYCTKLEKFTYPDSITIVKKGLFQGCSSLHTIEFPNGMNIESIESNVYSDVPITNIIFSPTCTVNKICKNAFLGLGITLISIPQCNVIENGAFSNCNSLQSVTISSLTTLQTNVFENCVSLTSISFPSSLTTIPERTFYGCSKLSTFDFSNIDTINSGAFCGCAFTNVVLNRVNTVKESAFMSCESLESVDFQSPQFTVLPESCFESCSSLQTVKYPNGVITVIGDKCFKECNKFDLAFKEGLLYIGSESFFNCANFRSALPSTVETIGSSAFKGAMMTKEFLIPNDIERIDSEAFFDTNIRFVKYCGQNHDLQGQKSFTVDRIYVKRTYISKTIFGSNAVGGLLNNCIIKTQNKVLRRRNHFVGIFLGSSIYNIE